MIIEDNDFVNNSKAVSIGKKNRNNKKGRQIVSLFTIKCNGTFESSIDISITGIIIAAGRKSFEKEMIKIKIKEITNFIRASIRWIIESNLLYLSRYS